MPNIPPVVDLNGATAGTGSTLNYTENAAASQIAPTGTATDTDSTDFNTGSLTVHFSANGAAEDQLSILNDATVTVSSGTVSVGGLAIGTVSGGTNGTDLVVSFNTTDATPTTVSTLIEHIGDANNSDNPSTLARSVLFTVNDGDGGSGSDTATINITAVNDPPTLTATAVSPTFTEGDASPADIFSSPVASTIEAGQTFSGMTVTIANVADGANEIFTFDGSQIHLSGAGSLFTSGHSIPLVVDFDGVSTFTLHFSGQSLTAAVLQSIIDGFAYSNTSQDPTAGNRVVTITQVVDSGPNTPPDDSTTDLTGVTSTINIAPVNDPPVINNVPATADYTENAAPVTFSAAFPNEIFVTDPDPFPHGAPGGNGLALSATVKIATGFVTGDELLVFDTTTATSDTSGFYTGINVQWDYDATTHILTLFSADPPTNSGDTLIDFAHVLDNVQFASTSDDPTNGGASNTRTLQWQIQDAGGTANGGNDLSAVYTTTLTVHAVNDAPVNTVPGAQSTNEDTALVFNTANGNAISVFDVDPTPGNPETVTLLVQHGTLTFGSTAGLSGVINNSATIVASGSISALNAALQGLTYTPAANYNGPDSLSVTIDDNGNTPLSAGVFLSDHDTVAITVNAVNDAPQLTGFGDVSAFTENGSSVRLDANQNATVSDLELNASVNKYAGSTLTLARTGGANTDDAFAGSGTLDLADSNGLGENVSLDSGATFIGTFSQPGDGTFSITFNANAGAAEINSVMHQIFYANASDNPPASVQIDFTFSDGNGQPGGQSQGTGATPGTATGSVTVNITQVDDAPGLLNVAPTAAYATGSPGVVLSPGLQVFDLDATPPSPLTGLAGATVKIESGLLPPSDLLFVNLAVDGSGHFVTPDGDPTNISGPFFIAGSLDLSGNDTVAHYQSVLDAVSYRSTSSDPSSGGADPTRTISWQVFDGLLNSQTPNPDPNNLVNETILHFDAPPALDLDASGAATGFTTTFTERAAPVAIADTDVSITDPDNSNLSSANIVLTNAKASDVMSIAGALPGGIDSSIDTSVPGQITVHLFNSASLADYQTALDQIRFANTSNVPDTTDRDITVVVNDGEGDSNVAHATVHVIDVHSGGNDFNADGRADILWQIDGGNLAIWEMNGIQISAADYTRLGLSQVGLPGPDWHIVDTADFDGDGKTDILWRTDSGAAAIWEMDGTHIKAADFIRNGSTAVGAPGPDWHQLGAADFDGDGKADILWRTDSGALAIWEMDGTHIKSADFIRNGSTAVGAPAPDWKIVGVGDFDGDGNNDLLWETGGGALAVWEMNGTHIKSADYIKSGSSNVGIPSSNWHVTDVGDFDGDGKADILWRVGGPPSQAGGLDPGGGQVAIWEMNGNQIKAADYTTVGSTAVGAPGNDWHLLGSDDYNGDGMNDILWRTDAGALAIWQMNGTHITAADYTKIGATNVGAPGADWHVFEHHYEVL